MAAYEAAWGPEGWEEYRHELSEVDLAISGVSCLGAVLGPELVGTITLVAPTAAPSSGLGSDALEIRMLAVDPAFQRRGVGRALLAAAAWTAAEFGLLELALQSDEDLLAAHRLYADYGFRRDPSIDTSVGGGWRALGFRLRLPLDASRC